MSVSELDHTVTGYKLTHAYWLARAAKLAYSDEAEIKRETAQWGFDRCEYFHVKFDPSFLIEDTQAFVAASDNMIIAGFRGTEPTNLRDWLTDANSLAAPGPAEKGMVHLGFSRALDAIYPQVRDAIQRFRDNDQTLWFTGHSLGGALAMLASARMYFEDPKLLADGVYTYGQPRTCDPTLASAYNSAFASRTFRFVNNNDVVPELPPEPVFHHVNDMKYFDSHGTLQDKKPSAIGGLTDSVKGHTASLISPGTDAMTDHFVDNYVNLFERALA